MIQLFRVSKEYGRYRHALTDVTCSIEEGAIATLKQGMWLADPRKGVGFKTGKCGIKVMKRAPQRTILEVTSEDGRNRCGVFPKSSTAAWES